ncbi:o-fucosyltransferase 20 [Quercus suber]|uniref:O-fucosyltransferase family protein n=1 Tax=Quercus suber TaxID=58331 RepID=A0AAW0KV84_QUESU
MEVTFHALRFAPPILELGNKLAERMRSKGPYLALHLRMEKDVWVRTDCLLGLSHEYDEIEDLAFPGELEPFANRASLIAVIDYIVSENSDVFMPSRQMPPYFLNSSLPEAEFNSIIKELHNESLGQPELRTNKVGRDVTKYPVPECMCNGSHTHTN